LADTNEPKGSLGKEQIPGVTALFPEVNRKSVKYTPQELLWRSAIISGILQVLYVTYFDLTAQVFKVLQPCNKEGYMLAYPWVSCSWSGLHLTLLAIGVTFLIIYVVGVPLLFSIILFKFVRKDINKDPQLSEPAFRFLHAAYKSKVYWFELLWIARRVLLSLLIAVLAGSIFQRAAIMSVLLGSLVIQLVLNPFKLPVDNFMDVVGVVSIIYTYAGGSAVTGYYNSDRESTLLAFGLLGINAIVFATYIILIIWRTLGRKMD